MSARTFAGAAASFGLVFSLAIGPGFAAFTWPGCGEVQESEFKYQALIGKSALYSPKVVDASLEEPIHMAFDLRPDNTTDIYWVERLGGIKRYNAAKNQVVKLGSLGVVPADRNEQGLVGIALDPAFKTNRWVYLFYSPSAENNVFRLSRFALNADLTVLDPASEKVLIRIPSQRSSCCHTGGAMAFDLYGDLWVAVGKNASDYPNSIDESNQASSSEATAANGADMRGGVIRIHPDNSDKGYVVPEGNYGDYWSNYFKGQGNSALAAEYADRTKVLPEIYVKGARNPYTLTVDPIRRWVTWGEYGVNLEATMTEEHNLITHPINGGYPYFAGGGGTGGTGCTYKNDFCELWRGFNTSAGTKDMAAPINNSKWNKGPKQLPPVEAALHTYPRSGAITGPIYWYNGQSPATFKFPPHFNKAWIVTDWAKAWFKIYKVSDDGKKLTDSLTWFTKFDLSHTLDVQEGPDGALYVNRYAGNRTTPRETNIGRIEYTGSCHPAEPKYPTLGSTSLGEAPQTRETVNSMLVQEAGNHRIRIKDAQGRMVYSVSQSGPREYHLRDLVADKGIYFVTVEGERGWRTFKLINF